MQIHIKFHRYSYLHLYPICHKRYYLGLLYTQLGGNQAFAVGSALHAALAVLACEKGEEAAFTALFAKLEDPEYIEVLEVSEDAALELLTAYLAYWRENQLFASSNEIKFAYTLQEGLPLYTGTKDGICVDEGKKWLVERKTTSSYLASFLKKFSTDVQTLGYSWATIQEVGEDEFGGVIVDVLQKKTSRHGFAFAREKFPYDKEAIAQWVNTTRWVMQEVQTSCKEAAGKGFPCNYEVCLSYYGKCEFYDYCHEGLQEGILLLTHKFDVKDGVEIITE